MFAIDKLISYHMPLNIPFPVFLHAGTLIAGWLKIGVEISVRRPLAAYPGYGPACGTV